jgi:hypothetical protein
MRSTTIALALLALAFGTTAAPVESKAQTTYVMPGSGYQDQTTIVERRMTRSERRAMREMREERRAARAERREMRALRPNDPDATASDLNRSQLRKLDQQDRAEQRAEMRRDERMMRRQPQLGY